LVSQILIPTGSFFSDSRSSASGESRPCQEGGRRDTVTTEFGQLLDPVDVDATFDVDSDWNDTVSDSTSRSPPMCRPGVTDLRLVRFVKRWLRGDRRRTVSESGSQSKFCPSTSADNVPCEAPPVSHVAVARTGRLADVSAADDRRVDRVTAVGNRDCVDRKCPSSPCRKQNLTAGAHSITAQRKGVIRAGTERETRFICCCRSRCTSLIVDDCLGNGPETLEDSSRMDDDERRQLTLASVESTSAVEAFCYCDSIKQSCSGDERGCVDLCSCRDDAVAILRKRSKSSTCCQASHQVPSRVINVYLCFTNT
jgi:hypothetical protein